MNGKLIRVGLVGLMAGLVALVLYGCGEQAPAPVASPKAPTPPERIATDVAPLVPDQKTCPVMGGAINKAIYTDYQGKRVYFCCAGCVSEFQKDPAKYIAKLTSASAK